MSEAAAALPARERETVKERIAVEAHLLAERLAMALPERAGLRLFHWLGILAFHTASRARRTVESNLARVLGERPGSELLRAATREAFRSYARYWHDTFFVKTLSAERFHARFEMRGAEQIEKARAAGRGAIIALPHLGNWDVAGRWVAEHGSRVVAVAEELRPRRMYELFQRHRRELGMEIVPLSDARKVGQELVSLLAQNAVLALVCDRDLRNAGVEVEMFGATRRMPAGPALLSLATGAPLVPCAPYDTPEGWLCILGAPLEIERSGRSRDDVKALTRLLAGEFERMISADPIQWHLFQPAWERAPAP